MEAVKIEIGYQKLKTANGMKEVLENQDMIRKVLEWRTLGLRYIGG